MHKVIDDQALKAENINVRDLMFYVTTKCNLRCKHCYVGNEWLNQSLAFEKQEASDLLHHFALTGLDRLTFLGGEPTHYKFLPDLIEQSRRYNIRERRITTNGTTLKYFDISRIKPSDLDHISFSFDSHKAKSHDQIRGQGSFHSSIKNLEYLQEKGFTVHITLTVMQSNIHDLEEIAIFFNKLGIQEINFHVLSLIGNAQENSHLAISPLEWVQAREKLKNIKVLKNIRLRIPPMFVTPREYKKHKEKGYKSFQHRSYHCPNGGHRIVLYPNGRVYMSCNLTGTDYHFANYREYKFTLNKSKNELSEIQNSPESSAPEAKLLRINTDQYIPLSISYKEIFSY